MPIHEYACGECGQEFEELVRRQGQKVSCPRCGSGRLRRKLSVFGAVVGAASGGPEGCGFGDACPRGSSCGGSCDFSDDD